MAECEQSYIVTVKDGLTPAQSVSVKSQIQETRGVSVQKTIRIGKLEFLVLQTTPKISKQIQTIPGVMDVEENKKIRLSPPNELKKQRKAAAKKNKGGSSLRGPRRNARSGDKITEERRNETAVLSKMAESKKKYIVTVDGGQTYTAVKFHIRETLGVHTKKPINIGKLKILVLETTPEISKQIRAIPGVMDVQENTEIRINPPVAATTDTEEENQTKIRRKKKLKAAGKKHSSWGCMRIAKRGNNSSPDDPAAGMHMFSDSDDGTGVDIFIVDSGIYIDHQDFNGRAVLDFVAKEFRREGKGDKYGHGTHVAGTAGGGKYGVAKGATLRSVKVMNESGICIHSHVVEGLEFIEAEFHAAIKKRNGKRPKFVVNMSLGVAEKITAIDEPVKYLAGMGILFVVAAGNEKEDACNGTPAHLEEVITVGATNQKDELWWESNYGSNYGPCVDILAPGSDILSAGIVHSSATRVDSGTSMAAPHVAGVIARYIQHMDEPPMPAEIKKWLKDTAEKGVVKLPTIASSTTKDLLHINCGPNPKDNGADGEGETGVGAILAWLLGDWARTLMGIFTGVVAPYLYRYLRSNLDMPESHVIWVFSLMFILTGVAIVGILRARKQQSKTEWNR